MVARALRDGGMEVIYTGLRQTSEQIVSAALQEDVDVLALSILSGAHLTLVPAVTQLMKERGLDDILILAGGVIPKEDLQILEEHGVAGIFGPGTPTGEIIEYIKEKLAERAGA